MPAIAIPGPHLAELTGGQWLPAAPEAPGDLSGHLRLGEVYVYLGMGTSDSDGHWLSVAYLYAKPRPDAESGDESATGTGAGTRVVDALRAYSDRTGVPVRFDGIENTAFFRRFDGWSDARLDDADEPDGECWHYPAAAASR